MGEKWWRIIWLKNLAEVNVRQKRIADALKTVALNYHAKRQTDTTCQINIIPYRADCFGHKLHVDQSEKLEMYGVVHVVVIDGHSRYIMCGTTMPSKDNKVIYAKVYRFILFLFCLLGSITWRVVTFERGCFLEGNDLWVPLAGFNSLFYLLTLILH